eukprot:TRINITY_DN8177_c0_g1_i5.p1 TRINITY_DN8177_c0_g1~~TRINITY_DN8177_c0_g1_i5.p1  ORF type:complete len:276 (-),score=51.39 TRINITY_DN8177_c0_g1_i5:1-828(-)
MLGLLPSRSHCIQSSSTHPKRRFSTSSDRTNIWKDKIISKEINKIDEARKTRIRPALSTLDGRRWKLVCPVCEKPNAIHVRGCTACGFPLRSEDVDELDENVFLKIINGSNMEHKVRHRDEEMLIFEDKFKISKYHLDAIPIRVIEDITHLTSTDVPLLERMYKRGMDCLREMTRDDPLWKTRDVEDHAIVGFNLPVSVYHLHCHMVLPPLLHYDAFKFPRFYPYSKVISQLKSNGTITPNIRENPDPIQEEWWQWTVSHAATRLENDIEPKSKR